MRSCIIFSLLLATANISVALAKSEDSACASWINQKHFVFRAQWASAYNGDRRQLTTPYELLLTADYIDAYLPFYGRIYRTLTAEEIQFMAIKFRSKAFNYQLKSSRRGSTITVTLNDNSDVRTLDFTISHNCWCTLWIRSANRDPMMYEGTVGPPH